MAIDRKYGRVTLERGTVGEDEPVVVFRAQDQLLPQLLVDYRLLCKSAGSPEQHLAAIDRAIESVESWQQDHYTQIPQSATAGAVCVCGHNRREHSLSPDRCRYTHSPACEKFVAE